MILHILWLGFSLTLLIVSAINGEIMPAILGLAFASYSGLNLLEHILRGSKYDY